MATIQGIPSIKRGPLAVALILAALLVALTSFPTIVRLLTDWYWFSALGFQSVFLTTIGTKLFLGIGVAILSFGFFYANLRFAQRGLVPDPVVVNLFSLGATAHDGSGTAIEYSALPVDHSTTRDAWA